mgnify:CR=1 FL=1|jgi:hypothetical protein
MGDGSVPPHILVLCRSHLSRDARVLRQVEALREVGTVSCAAFSPSGLETGSFHRLGEDNTVLGWPPLARKALTLTHGAMLRLQRIAGAHEAAYWGPVQRHARRMLRRVKADLIVANDVDTLPLAFAIAGPTTRVLFDAHEFHPGQHAGDDARTVRARRAVTHLCRRFVPKVHHFITVSDAVAEAYHDLTGVHPTVITNAPAYRELRPVHASEGPIRLVHHGGAFPQRDSAALMTLMDLLGPGFELHLYMVGDSAVLDRLRHMAAARTNVFMHDPVPPTDVPAIINGYDIGVHRLPPGPPNHEFALPNKLFDFVQARLAIAVSPNRAMATLVREHGLGVVAASHDVASLADVMRPLSREEILRFKQRAHEKAHELSATANMSRLVGIAQQLLGHTPVNTSTSASHG